MSRPPPIHSTDRPSQPSPSSFSHIYNVSSPGQRNFLPKRRFNISTSENVDPSSYKRAKYNDDSSEPRNQYTKKKSVSQIIPKKKYTAEDAERAFNIECEYNNNFKNHNLVIKFPDEELNKDIILKFHQAIETVYFQQPTNARFCFVTLKESADVDAVIAALNKQKFGNGYLSVEYKKDKDYVEDILDPSNIDPLILYVGNLSEQVTKADLTRTYPANRRVDIGFARKMRHTRYAFVSFNNVEDAIKAFLSTRNAQLYSKSLIVRFRRLYASKVHDQSLQQNLQKSPTSISTAADVLDADSNTRKQEVLIPANDYSRPNDTSPLPDSNLLPRTGDATTEDVGSSVTKSELFYEDRNPSINTEYKSPFAPSPVNAKLFWHKPKIEGEIEKKEIQDDVLASASNFVGDVQIKQEKRSSIEIKKEPICDVEEFHNTSESDLLPHSGDATTEDVGSFVTKSELVENEDRKPCINTDYKSPFAPGPVNAKLFWHKPKIEGEIKTEKKEIQDDVLASVSNFVGDMPIKQEKRSSIEIKKESICDVAEFHNASNSDLLPHTGDVSTVGVGSSVVKLEPLEVEDIKPCINSVYKSPFAPGPINAQFIRHKPKIEGEIKTKIKIEKNEIQDDELEEFDFQKNYELAFPDTDDDENDDILDRPIDIDQLMQDMDTHDNVLRSLRRNALP